MKPHIVKRKGYWRVANPLGGKMYKPCNQKILNRWAVAYEYVAILNRLGR